MKIHATFFAFFVTLLSSVGCSDDDSTSFSNETDFISFKIDNPSFITQKIDKPNQAISIVAEFGSDLTGLIASFTLSDGASATVDGLEQVSDITMNDFTNPVTYKITAQDQATQSDWTVMINTLEEQPVVNTLASLPSNGGIAVKSDGTLYTTSESNTIYKISPDGEVETFLTNNANVTRATQIIFDNDQEFLYVSNTPTNQLGWITRVDMDGNTEVFVGGFSLPTGIAFDSDNNLYVADQNNNVWKVDQDGNKSVLINSTDFNRPHGMAWANGNLYISSAHDGKIFKLSTLIDAPTAVLFAKVDGLQQQWASGYMIYANESLYITNGDNIIHEVSMTGVVSDYAGTGDMGSRDGPASVAEFNGPNGIGGSSDGSIIYVGEYGVKRIRAIND